MRAKFEHAVPKQHQRAAAVAAAPADGLRRNKQRRHSRAAAATRAAMQLAAVQRAAAREQLEIRNRAAKDEAIGGRRPHGVRSGECCVAEGKAAQPSAHTARESVQPVGCGTRATASTGLNAQRHRGHSARAFRAHAGQRQHRSIRRRRARPANKLRGGGAEIRRRQRK